MGCCPVHSGGALGCNQNREGEGSIRGIWEWWQVLRTHLLSSLPSDSPFRGVGGMGWGGGSRISFLSRLSVLRMSYTSWSSGWVRHPCPSKVLAGWRGRGLVLYHSAPCWTNMVRHRPTRSCGLGVEMKRAFGQGGKRVEIDLLRFPSWLCFRTRSGGSCKVPFAAALSH